MKKVIVSVFCFVLGAGLYAADPGIENVIVRQRWPWSPVVDIDFTVTGSATGVKFIAQYDGAEPFRLAEKDLSGEFTDILAPGLHHVSWNPVKAGLGNVVLKNFSVSIEVEDKTYLILNLVDGSYRYEATAPEGGWIDHDAAYYQTNMVFRRVPAGRFTMGFSEEMIAHLPRFSDYAGLNVARPMEISSDYYMAVYKTSAGQHLYMTNTAAGKTTAISQLTRTAANKCTYNELRGATNETDGINWPHTGHAVAPGSTIAMYRNLVRDTFPSEWVIDLPTSAQWVRAARANTPDTQYWSNGGTVNDSMSELSNKVNQVALWLGNSNGYNRNLGNFGPEGANGWGFYDFSGCAFEWALDWYGWFDTAVDPLGPISSEYGRVRCGSYSSTSLMCWMPHGFIYRYQPDNPVPGYRLCIHLKKLVEDK